MSIRTVPSSGIPGNHMDARPQHRVMICILFMLWSFFSVFVYAKFSDLGDSGSYLKGLYGDAAQPRTLLVMTLAMQIQSIVGAPFLVHLVFAAFSASSVVYLINQARPQGRAFRMLLLMLLMPNFGVWASVVGREALFIGALGFTMGATLGYYREGRGIVRMLIAVAGVGGMIFMRAPYGLGLGLFVLMFFIYTNAPRTRLGIGIQAVLMAIIGVLVLMVSWSYIETYINTDVLPEARAYFSLASATTRTWVNVSSTTDLFRGLWWEIPLALIGPTPGEAFSRPAMVPFFISGCTIFGLLLYSIYLSFSSQSVGNVRKILLLGWLPAVLILVVAFTPFGIYNPGSAIRYSSSFLLFLVYPPLLLWVAGLQPERGMSASSEVVQE